MKTALFIFSLCLSMLISSTVWADDPMSFKSETDSESFCTECQCTDLGYRYNDCMSKRKYCRNFGNVGMR